MIVAPPPVALSVSPSHVALVAPASRALEVRNAGVERLVVEVESRTQPWVVIRPVRLVLPAGATGRVIVRVRARGAPRPGDHRLLVLFEGRATDRRRVAVRLRIGVALSVRVRGRLVRQLQLGRVTVRRPQHERLLLVPIANGGNVTEQLGGRVSLTLVRRGTFVSRLRLGGRRELLPEHRTVLRFRYAGRARGLMTAVVRVRRGSGAPLERRYRLRL